MQHHESQKLVLRIAAAGLALNFLLNLAAYIFPPDMSQNPPHYPKVVLIAQSLGVAAVIFSSTIMGLKLTEEKRTLPAAGFTMFAIANGIGLVIFFELRQFTREEYEKIYDIYTSAMALLVPSCALLTYFNDVPKWIRWLPLISCLFSVIPIVMFYMGNTQFNLMDEISFIGWNIMNVAMLLWGIYIWRLSAKAPAA